MTWLFAIGRFLKRVPWQLWAALAAAIIIWRVADWHHDQVAAAEQRGAQAEGRRIAAKALKIAAEAAALSENARRLNSETNRRIAAGADTLRLSGPGKAACLNPATPGAGRHVAPAGPGNGPRAEVPSGNGVADGLPEYPLAAVPWPWLVDRAEQCDLNRAEAETWRSWHRQLEEWTKAQAK